ncbi:hypothetical protein D9758_012627 [Tetrapyrgos nigripes]|uniref:Uncharacterized protein n=1 Tax=Tetrapyrgos nigripes TaxID=182062 RepID=A0A8H5GDU9_9AGAR|nr:hypothetical protein D9758_012627 [Tetrapyrgos nigripes]
MVAKNPLLSGRISLRKKFMATVINDIWPDIMFFTLVATAVHLVTTKTSLDLEVNNALLGVLGTVLGLVLSFRTSSAYEKYQDGRKMWSNVAIQCRNAAVLIWLHVPNERPAQNGGQAMSILEGIIEKKSMINLVQAFAVSVKHYCRGESGAYYQDLYPLISFLPRYSSHGGKTEADMLPLWHASEDREHPYDHTQSACVSPSASASGSPAGSLYSEAEAGITSGSARLTQSRQSSWFTRTRNHDYIDPEKVLPTVHVHRPLKPARNPPSATIYDYMPFLRIFRVLGRVFSKKGDNGVATRSMMNRKKPELGDSNVPLEIIMFLSGYADRLLRTGTMQAVSASALISSINALSDTLSNLERIGNTPLPFAYQAHLRMSLWIYLFFLPFQIESVMGYLTIPGTAFAAFLFLGFLEIGQEIENPFNYDLNDLDLDMFCLGIMREMNEITAHAVPESSKYVFSSYNQPFAPADRRSAEDLVKQGTEGYTHTGPGGHGVGSQPGLMSIERTLLKAWKDVDEHARR